MTAYLLCAGFGTRMRPLTDDTPKSLLSVAGRPILGHLLDELHDWAALDAIHMVVNHRDADAFRDWAAGWRDRLADPDISLTLHDNGVATTDEQRGAVADLRLLLEQTGPPANGALISGGDSLYRFPLAPVLNAFDGTTSRVLALHAPTREQQHKSSVLHLDGAQVTGLGPAADAPSPRICPSWYLLTPGALAAVEPYLRAGGDPDALGAFLDVVAQREPLTAIRLPEQDTLRLHCNTPEDLERARALLDNDPRHLLDADAVRACLPA